MLLLPPAVRGLATFGFLAGPLVDSIHNQVLLEYDFLPLHVNLHGIHLESSLIVPPLLAVAYPILGSALPTAASRLLPADDIPGSEKGKEGLGDRGQRAAFAIASTIAIVKMSAELVNNTSALAVLYSLAFLQWALLDRRLSSLAVASLASIGGPLAELPLMKAGAWHYLHADFWPLAAWGWGEGVPGSEWAGLALITGPCYFAVTMDAIAIGRYLDREEG